MLKINIISSFSLRLFSRMFSLGVPPPAALGGVSYRTRRSFCRIRFDLTPRGLRLKNRHLNTVKPFNTYKSLICKRVRDGILKKPLGQWSVKVELWWTLSSWMAAPVCLAARLDVLKLSQVCCLMHIFTQYPSYIASVNIKERLHPIWKFTFKSS